VSPQAQTLRRGTSPVVGSAPLAATSETRQAALLLHGLPPGDRRWLLQQLSGDERASLQALLAELETLGIPADRALLDEAVSARAAPVPADDLSSPRWDAPGAEREDVSAQLALLESADPRRLGAILRDESPGLIVRLLELREWPWRERLLAQLGAPKRRHVEEQLARRERASSAAAPVPPVALQGQLVSGVLRRLRQGSDERSGDRSVMRSGQRCPRGSMSRERRVSGWLPRLGWFRRLGART